MKLILQQMCSHIETETDAIEIMKYCTTKIRGSLFFDTTELKKISSSLERVSRDSEEYFK